jgi:hypothetical protein
MNRKIIVFGTGDAAELADFYFTHDSEFEVAAFTVDQSYLAADQYRGRAVVPFERVTEVCPPD